ncbi:hypothetical protein [Blastococcus brunescens]|uniref:Uncharacterized protein n=1 Tax=Blastococcus brunescens TaxID=1564165 RepID=A0ABZ1B3Y3_9ACTN|nr:hypothetical protein [Blastococcus sp. BMG 8361]WRL64054.1 hypothetical protein U6N30_31470 [Blastococcus sp. BMG 8361]
MSSKATSAAASSPAAACRSQVSRRVGNPAAPGTVSIAEPLTCQSTGAPSTVKRRVRESSPHSVVAAAASCSALGEPSGAIVCSACAVGISARSTTDVSSTRFGKSWTWS